MIRSGLGRLEHCWRVPHVITSASATSCCLHSPQQLDIHGILHFSRHRHHRASPRALQVRHYSHIIRSPFKDVDIPNKLIQEVIWETVDKFPESIAIKCGLTGRAYTFAEIQKLSYRFANSLRQAGFKKGEIVALVMPNCPEYAIVVLGALEAELSLSFINHGFTDVEICHQLKDSGSVCILAASEKLDTVLSAVAKVEEKTQSKPFRRIIAIDIPSPESLPSGVVRFSEMIGSNVDSSPKPTQRVQPNDLAFLPYSSGTTGLPKGVCLSHKSIVGNLLQVFNDNGWRITSPKETQDISLGLLPFYHAYGLIVILIASLAHGGQIVTLPKFEQESFINTLENEKISVMKLVPPLILFLGDSDKVLPKHLANVRFMVCGAAPLGTSDMEKVEVKLHSAHKPIITQVYGMSELSPIATLPPIPPKDLITIGMPVANTFAKVINPDTGESLGVHEPGELCIKGPQIMLGYHNNAKATSEMLDSEGWLRTGDLAYYDEDNHFYIKDRLKEIIKVKGFQVPPAELEEVLRTHPCISDVGVIGVPCPRAGETPVAYIVQKQDKKLTVDDVKHFLAGKVSKHKQVSEVIFCDNIPKSQSGKILRKTLRELYNSDHNLP